jgi:hypothetical protein
MRQGVLMLSLNKCRSILGPACRLTDSELEELRHLHYALADVISEAYLNKRVRANLTTPLTRTQPIPCQNERFSFEKELKKLAMTERDWVIERAGIMEIDGGLDRKEAENMALELFFKNSTGRN